ncbi:MAG: choline kinase family protein [Defluviitaleaceae bacterium]|nr:choline kinase family protein [Defluviitaleaceae bacterium]
MKEEGAMQDIYNVSKISSKVFGCNPSEIMHICPIKKGMTNHSYTFVYANKKYILRIPGEGTHKLINRQKECDVYQKIAPLNLSDHVVYIDPVSGYKITEFWDNARVCNPTNPADVTACMIKLQKFHATQLVVDHSFCPFEKIEFYESLRNTDSRYADYAQTKARVLSLNQKLAQYPKQFGLTHIDAVPDNFIFLENNDVRIIDWEYSAMQDQHLDIAMFAVYSMYNRKQIEQLLLAYFTQGCPASVRTKIYSYIAVCGLLWSNWCEYKEQLGICFGEYATAQYNFAKKYSHST